MATSLFAIYFGTTNIGFNCGLLSFAPAISGTSFLAITHALSNATDEYPCLTGKDCYSSTILLLISTLSIGFVLMTVLTHFHYRKYHKIHYDKL